MQALQSLKKLNEYKAYFLGAIALTTTALYLRERCTKKSICHKKKNDWKQTI